MPDLIGGLLIGGAAAGWFANQVKKDREKRRESYREWKLYDPANIHGKARFADYSSMVARGLFEDRGGVPVGYYQGHQIFHNDATSILTFGKSGEGKGSQALIPALLQSPKVSFVVPDIDGEAFTTTAEQRLKYGPVVVVDAYQMFPNLYPQIPRGRYSPMGFPWLAPTHPHYTPRCAKLGAGAVSKGHGRDEYWYLGARQLTSDFIATVRKHGKDESANLTRIAELIHGDPFHFARWVSGRIDDPYLRARLSRWANPSAMDIRSLPEVVENTKTQLNCWLDPAVAETTRDSTFNFSQCAEQVMTVYILVPHELLDAGSLAKYFTTLTNCALSELIRFNPSRRVRTVVMLDEFFELPLDGIDHLLVSARKANTVLWLCLQDLAELRDMYPKTATTLIGNCGCVQFMSARDLDGSEFVSHMLGQTEVRALAKTRSWSAGARVHDPPTWAELEKLNVTFNESQQARPLMLPQEVRALPATEQILFMDGIAPIKCDRKSYLDVPALRSIAGRNPWYQVAEDDVFTPAIAGDSWMKLLG